MLQLAILSCFFVSINGKMLENSNNLDYNDLNDLPEDSSDYYYDSPAIQDGDLWVLNLKDDWNSLQLITPDREKAEEFYALNGFLIREHKLHQMVQNMLRFFKPRRNTVNPITPRNGTNAEKKYSLVEAQQNLWQIINKIMLHDEEPGMEITDSLDSGAAMELYFNGPYCALIVTMKKNQWNFFMPPPSLLSTWFADIHIDSRTKSIQLSDNTKEPLFRHLMKILLLSYNFPNAVN